MILAPTDVLLWPKECVGGKAWGLAKLASVARVPAFRVIVPDEDLESDIDHLIREFTSDSQKYAVRSSAAMEDSGTASYAGMFLTLLAVPVSQLREAIPKVAASGQTSRVKEFEQAIGRQMVGQSRISVVIQEMVDASSSGVALSYAPNTARKHALVEAIFGLGELLVSGKVPPDSWVVDRNTKRVLRHQVGHQVWKQTPTGRTLLRSFECNLPKLNETQINSVCDLLFAIETHLPLPSADLEFCFANDTLFALQARPLLSS